MTNDSGQTTSVWMATAELPQYPRITSDATADVCVVGAGIAGMTTAYLLGREGKRVIVLDDGGVGGGETGRTTAHLSNALDDRYYRIQKLFGESGARAGAESHSAAIERIERTVREEGIDCDFERVDGFLFLGDSDDILDEELDAARKAGLVDLERVSRAPIDGFDTGPALRFPRQGQFHPLKYLAGLARAIERDGGRIFGQSHVEEIEGKGPVTVKTSDGVTVTALDVVVATNTPVNDWVQMHTKQAPYRTYVIGARVRRGELPHGLYWDNQDPYHYVRLQPIEQSDAQELLIVGGEDHKTGQEDDTEARFIRLEKWLRERFPSAEAIEYRWSGQVMEPADYMGFLGRNPGDQHTYIITGDSGMGMTHGTIGGMLVTDLIVGRENPWEELYDPSRKTLRAAPEFVKENLNVAIQYADWLALGDTPAEIEAGEGAVVRRGAHLIAAFRDAAGMVHEHSAVCPHLKCIVQWNRTEKSWDCPCHGSRFDAHGEVLNGPAVSALTPAPSHPGRPREPKPVDQPRTGDSDVSVG